MQLPEHQNPEETAVDKSTPETAAPPSQAPFPAAAANKNKQKAKRILIFLGIALVVLLLLNLIPFDTLTQSALDNLPENTEPVVTFGDDYFYEPVYGEDVSQDQIYQKFNRNMNFTRENETVSVTESNKNTNGMVCRLLYDYFEILKAGDTAAYNALFTDEYIAENGKAEFAPQKVFDMSVSVQRTEFLVNGDANGDYKGYTVTYCEVAYKIYQNNGTLRRDFYQDDSTKPVIFEVLEKDGVAQINQIIPIRENQPEEQGGSVVMYIIWIAVIALSIFLEANSAALTAIWFMPAALVSLILALCGCTWQTQVITFAVLALIFVLIGTLVIKKRFQKKKHTPTNADRILGTEGLVTEEINNTIPTGEVKTDGKRWSARSADDSIIEAGALVTVLRIEGVKLIVEKKNPLS